MDTWPIGDNKLTKLSSAGHNLSPGLKRFYQETKREFLRFKRQ